jgi:hypothetical protein
MSLHTAAKHLQSKGRNNDTMLVHMTPREVKGLQQLAMASGGSLTINPDTGLPEAGWLDSLLPMLGGAALTLIPGVGPLAAAGIMASGYGLATGSVEKGLLAGLSAYGGAGLAGSLASAGGSALAEAGGATATNLGEQALTNTATQALPAGYSTAGSAFTPTEMLSGSVNPAQFANAQAGAAQSVLSNPNNFTNLVPEQLSAMQSAAANAANPMDVVRSAGMANATTGITPAQATNAGIKDVFSSGSKALDFAGDNKMALASAVLPAATSAFGQQGINAPVEDTSDDGDYLQRLSPNFRGRDPIRPNPYYEAQYPTYAASGGLMDANPPPTPGLMDGSQAANVNFMGKDMYPMSQQDPSRYAIPSQMPTSAQQSMARYDQDINPLTGQVSMASGGIAGYSGGGFKPVSHLPVKGVYSDSDPDTAKKPADQAAMIRLNKILAAANLGKAKMPKTSIKGLGDIPDVAAGAGGGSIGGYSDGGRMLKGPGDGMSDSIPAVIGKKQPARLADGEFVVPADVVSHLGNGSTDAGAKKLYAMMDKIRKARTGKKKQAPAVNVNKYLPA